MGRPGSAARLGADDLKWSEVADAVWLASVTQHAWQRHPAPERPAQDRTQQDSAQQDSAQQDRAQEDRAQPPAAAETTDSGILRESEPDEHVEPSGFLLPRYPERDRRDDRAPRRSADSGSVAPPVAPHLPGADIVRVLRPLKRRVPSWHEDEVILDEEATAERAVQDGLWLPVTKPDTTRLLDLTLVVDASPSMALWRSTVREVISLAEQLGAFRSIQLRLLDTEPPAGSPAFPPGTPALHGGTLATPPRSPAELLDSSGRRILLVLTDGVGRCWREDLVSPLLAQWGAAMPLAVIHLLPQRLWARGGLALHRARLTVPGPLRPNQRWELELPDAWLEPDPAAAAPAGVVPVPVLELEARWLGWWAQLVTGRYRDPADAIVLLAGSTTSDHAREPASLRRRARESHGSAGGEASAQERVRNFLSVASPAAFRLVTLLAAVPVVSLPVARLVQAELVPESGLAHLVEVFTSGLLRPLATVGRSWDTITFGCLEAVRETLLSKARRAETMHVVRLVAERFGDQISALRHFRDALDAPDSTPDPPPTAEAAHWVAIEQTVLRALSGPYLCRADRLRNAGTVPSDTVPSDTLVAANTVAPVDDDDTMAAVADRTDVVSEPTRPLTPPPSSPAHDGESLAEATTVGTPAATPPGPLTGFTPVSARERQADSVPPIWGDVPPRNLNFTGRVELLQQLDERLTAGGATAVLPAALHGMGGIGKTQMAVEYIYRHLQDYDIIWWIQATQPAQIRSGLTELAKRLDLPGSSEAHTAVAAVREALRLGQPYRRWLLVFDAAEAPEAVRSFFPANGPGEILITSRNPDWAGIARPLEVAVFTREESKELLRRRGPEITDAEADRLAEVLGDLPLAIEQAAAWRAETGMPVGEYLRLFEEKRAEILDTSAPVDYAVSVAAAWNVSFDELRTRSPAAHQLLQVCAFFAPEPISRSLFTGVRGVSISPELDAALRDPMRLSRAIRDISRYGLAKIDHRNGTLQLHRLVQLVLSNRMTPQRWAEMRHGAHHLLANYDPNDPASTKQWPRYQDMLPHVYAAEVIECDDPWGRQLVLNLMTFLYYWGDHEEAARLARLAVDVWSEKLGEKDLQALQAAGNLGFYLWTLGQYVEAAEINQRTVELYRQVSGENSEETILAELAVATDLKASGDFTAALDLNERTYQKAKGLFGEDDPTTLQTAHDLLVSLGLAGEYRRGRELGEDTYRRWVDVLGYDSPSTAATLNALNLAQREAGDYGRARAEQEKLVERSRELFGADTAVTLGSSHHLSVARRKDGDHQGALELSTQALDRFRARYGDNHPGAMACALAQSIDLRHAGDLGSACKLGEQTLDRYRHSLGENHPHTLSALLDLAVTLRLLGDAAGARQLDERSLEQFRAALGPDHPHAIVSAINLASDLAALGETEVALALGTEALDRASRVLGADHPTTLAVLTNLVLDLRTLGRTQDAETKYTGVVTRYRRVLGDAHPATIAAASGQRADCDIDPLPL
jgi:tetratricopeptide (TPR) repeat protein